MPRISGSGYTSSCPSRKKCIGAWYLLPPQCLVRPQVTRTTSMILVAFFTCSIYQIPVVDCSRKFAWGEENKNFKKIDRFPSLHTLRTTPNSLTTAVLYHAVSLLCLPFNSALVAARSVSEEFAGGIIGSTWFTFLLAPSYLDSIRCVVVILKITHRLNLVRGDKTGWSPNAEASCVK